ncbi:hypothetical protein [Halomonas aestuarii]|uniref:hypothetical protein n=1 Tax=Halomonas aestuarii TaxID=1897729 RepID=UPI000F77D197|nr:hypothetical protein [Halomonas aestuarii]
MKKALYITCYNITDPTDGISKKIQQQLVALHEIGYEVNAAYSEKGCLRLVYNCGQSFSSGNLSEIKSSKPLFFLRLAAFLKNEATNYDVFYIRNPHGNLYSLFFSYFLYAASHLSKKVILEIPSYPYDDEVQGLLSKLSLIIHKIQRPFFKLYISKIFYTGMLVDQIWGVPSSRIYNSCDPSDVPLANFNHSPCPKAIRLIAVANLAPWHGYDRVLYGLHYYINSSSHECNVFFHIVGDNEPEFSRLKKITENLGLDHYVKFHGRMISSQIDNLFVGCSVGVDSLGRHRSGNSYNDSIKSKEYAFRGVPFIKSHRDDSFNNVGFVYNAPQDDSWLMIEEIVDWVSCSDFDTYAIRDFAMNNFQWKKQLEKFI